MSRRAMSFRSSTGRATCSPSSPRRPGGRRGHVADAPAAEVDGADEAGGRHPPGLAAHERDDKRIGVAGGGLQADDSRPASDRQATMPRPGRARSPNEPHRRVPPRPSESHATPPRERAPPRRRGRRSPADPRARAAAGRRRAGARFAGVGRGDWLLTGSAVKASTIGIGFFSASTISRAAVATRCPSRGARPSHCRRRG